MGFTTGLVSPGPPLASVPLPGPSETGGASTAESEVLGASVAASVEGAGETVPALLLSPEAEAVGSLPGT